MHMFDCQRHENASFVASAQYRAESNKDQLKYLTPRVHSEAEIVFKAYKRQHFLFLLLITCGCMYVGTYVVTKIDEKRIMFIFICYLFSNEHHTLHDLSVEDHHNCISIRIYVQNVIYSRRKRYYCLSISTTTFINFTPLCLHTTAVFNAMLTAFEISNKFKDFLTHLNTIHTTYIHLRICKENTKKCNKKTQAIQVTNEQY